MAKTKTPKAPKVEKAAKTPKIDPATGLPAPKKPRKVVSRIVTLSQQLEKLTKSEAAVDKHIVANQGKRASIVARLTAWGKLPVAAGNSAVSAAVAALVASGFEPPKGRVAVEAFKEGDKVELKPDFVAVYSTVYDPEELASMTYAFYDEVNKAAMITTVGKTMAAKLKHIQSKTVDAAPAIA